MLHTESNLPLGSGAAVGKAAKDGKATTPARPAATPVLASRLLHRVLQGDNPCLLHLVPGMLQLHMFGRRREQGKPSAEEHRADSDLHGVHKPHVQETAKQEAAE